MKKVILNLVAVLVMALMFAGCNDEEPVWIADDVDDIAGTWLQNERGYGTAFAGQYVIEPVSAFSARLINFFADGRMSSNIEELSDCKFYEIALEQQDQSHYLIVYKTEEDAAEGKVKARYDIDFPNGELKLSFRQCYEGCHIKLSKIGSNDNQE
jgi:hypothetical protein